MTLNSFTTYTESKRVRFRGYRKFIHQELKMINRSCYNCDFCKARISWWCTNKKSIDYHKTAIPGRHNCLFWERDNKGLNKSKSNLFNNLCKLLRIDKLTKYLSRTL